MHLLQLPFFSPAAAVPIAPVPHYLPCCHISSLPLFACSCISVRGGGFAVTFALPSRGAGGGDCCWRLPLYLSAEEELSDFRHRLAAIDSTQESPESAQASPLASANPAFGTHFTGDRLE